METTSMLHDAFLTVHFETAKYRDHLLAATTTAPDLTVNLFYATDQMVEALDDPEKLTIITENFQNLLLKIYEETKDQMPDLSEPERREAFTDIAERLLDLLIMKEVKDETLLSLISECGNFVRNIETWTANELRLQHRRLATMFGLLV